MLLLSRFSSLVVALMLLTFSASVFAIPPMNLPYGVTPISHQIYDLHMIAFYICIGIGVIVFGALIYSLLKFRKSKGAVAKDIHEHLGLEILWTIIPFVILIIMAIPATKLLIEIHNTDKPALDIKVTGYQWKWKYDYLDEGISFYSNMSTPRDEIYGQTKKNKWFLLEVDHPVVVPIHKKVRLLVTSNDVIHSWWVPALGLKQDAVPGYINENWFTVDTPGTYRGQCAELCGVNHGFMPIVVKAVSEKEFAKWVSDQKHMKLALASESNKKLDKKTLLKLGKAQYKKSCAACHQTTGLGLPPTFPALKGSKIVTGPVKQNINVVLYGVKGTAMQAFGEQLDNKSLAAVITYIRNAWGNDAINKKNKHKTTVQPNEVKQARKVTT